MDALFKDVWHAIRFAYAVDGGALYMTQQSTLGKALTPSGGMGKLTPEEWRAEAGMILADVLALPNNERWFVQASHSWGPERVVAVMSMRLYAGRQLADSAPAPVMLEQVTTRYFTAGLGGRPSQAQIARANDCHPNTVANWDKRLAEVFKRLESQVEATLHGKWVDGRIPQMKDAIRT